MTAIIQVPDSTDMHKISELLACANELAQLLIQQTFDSSIEDLPRIQAVLDAVLLAREDTIALQALGMALGQVFAAQNPHYDWWMIDDNEGRDPCLRYRDTSLLVYPQTLLSRRVEAGEVVKVDSLYHHLVHELSILAAQQHPHDDALDPPEKDH